MVLVDIAILRRRLSGVSLGICVAVSSFGLARVATEVSDHRLFKKGGKRGFIMPVGWGKNSTTRVK